MGKYVYLLELQSGEQPVNIGVFTSRSRAEAFVKTLPKKNQYVVYQLPTNTKLTRGRKMEYNQGEYEHWHFGTLDAIVDEVDADGNVIGAKDEKFLIWPD